MRGAERHAPAAPYLVSSKNNSDAIADEESVCVRIHRSEDASPKSEAVFLDVYVAKSAFADGSDPIVESISDASKARAERAKVFRGNGDHSESRGSELAI